MKNKILGYLLSIPNSNINALPINKQKFYSFKDKFLQRFCLDDGFDLQHILKICYSCGGTGKYEHSSGLRERCWRCRKGIFEDTYVVLARYQLGGWFFHRPVATKRFEKPKIKFKNEISGYIEREKRSKRAVITSFLLLTFFFDHPLFWVSLFCLLDVQKNKALFKFELARGGIRRAHNNRFWKNPARDSVDDSIPF